MTKWKSEDTDKLLNIILRRRRHTDHLIVQAGKHTKQTMCYKSSFAYNHFWREPIIQDKDEDQLQDKDESLIHQGWRHGHG